MFRVIRCWHTNLWVSVWRLGAIRLEYQLMCRHWSDNEHKIWGIIFVYHSCRTRSWWMSRLVKNWRISRRMAQSLAFAGYCTLIVGLENGSQCNSMLHIFYRVICLYWWVWIRPSTKSAHIFEFRNKLQNAQVMNTDTLTLILYYFPFFYFFFNCNNCLPLMQISFW